MLRNRRIGAKYTYMLHPVQTAGRFLTDMTTKNKVRTTRQRWSDVSDMRQNYRQLDAMDCGPACLKMIAGYWGCGYSLGGEDKL